MTAPKVLMILFDGAEWNVIDPLVRAGRLPNLATLMQAGSYGRLQSLDDVALASPILWTSMASGKLPEKHGVKDFYDTAAAVRCVRLWEIFEHEKRPIGLFRYLITWPPSETAGFVVPDWCARTPEAYPPSLTFINTMAQARDLRSLARNALSALRHGMRLSTAALAMREVLRGRLFDLKMLDTRFSERRVELAHHTDLFVNLVRRHQPYFTAFYTGLPDAIQHQYWKFMEPQKFQGVSASDIRRYGEAIPRTYEALDEALGRILRVADDETLVVVASDHGGEANVEEEYRWAEVRGDALSTALGLGGAMTAFRIGARTYFRLRPATGAPVSIHEVADRLRTVTLDGSSTPVFDVTVSADDEMSAKVMDLKDSIEGAHLRLPDGRRFPVEELLNLTPTISGNHSMNGILLLAGPHVRRGSEITGAGLMDVTPTILALLGRPVGKDMDGRVLTDAIDPAFLRRQPVTFIESYDALLGKRAEAAPEMSDVGMEQVQERLRALGYID